MLCLPGTTSSRFIASGVPSAACIVAEWRGRMKSSSAAAMNIAGVAHAGSARIASHSRMSKEQR